VTFWYIFCILFIYYVSCAWSINSNNTIQNISVLLIKKRQQVDQSYSLYISRMDWFDDWLLWIQKSSQILSTIKKVKSTFPASWTQISESESLDSTLTVIMNLKSLKTQFVLWIKNIGFGTRESGFASPFLTKKVQFNSIHKDLYLKPSTLQIIKGLMVILLEVYIT
jgi:hypothetical protein